MLLLAKCLCTAYALYCTSPHLVRPFYTSFLCLCSRRNCKYTIGATTVAPKMPATIKKCAPRLVCGSNSISSSSTALLRLCHLFSSCRSCVLVCASLSKCGVARALSASLNGLLPGPMPPRVSSAAASLAACALCAAAAASAAPVVFSCSRRRRSACAPQAPLR